MSRSPLSVKPGQQRVRCLGPVKREHTFVSAAPSERVCPRCRRLQTAMHLSPQRVVLMVAPAE